MIFTEKVDHEQQSEGRAMGEHWGKGLKENNF